MAYILIAAIFLAMTLLNVFAMRPYDKPLLKAKPLKLREVLIDMLRIQKRSGGFFWFVFGSFLIYMGVSGFQFFGVYYIEGILHITRPDDVDRAVQISGLLSLLLGMIFAIGAGLLSDKLGRRNIITFSVLIASVVGLLFLRQNLRYFPLFLSILRRFQRRNSQRRYRPDQRSCATGRGWQIHAASANLAIGVANGIAPPLFGLIIDFTKHPNAGQFHCFFRCLIRFLHHKFHCDATESAEQIKEIQREPANYHRNTQHLLAPARRTLPTHSRRNRYRSAPLRAGGARAPYSRRGQMDQVIAAVRQQTALVIQCGMSSLPIPDHQDVWTRHADMVSMIVSHHDEAFTGLDVHVLHPREELEESMRLCNQYCVKPELEVWHAGSIWNMRYLIDRGLLPAPYFTTLLLLAGPVAPGLHPQWKSTCIVGA